MIHWQRHERSWISTKSKVVGSNKVERTGTQWLLNDGVMFACDGVMSACDNTCVDLYVYS
jgi:hypothetical protein